MKSRQAEIFFPALIFILGALLVLITPIGAGTDEETHLGRIWEMSKGALIPNQYLSTGPLYPFAFYELSYRQDVNMQPVSWNTWVTQLSTKIDWDNMVNHITRARYFPTFYLPQAFIIGIFGRLLDTPVAIIYYILRFSYLITYALLVYLAIRITPIAKWLFGVIAATPMSLILAGTISADSINNGVVFVFIAWILYMNRPQPVNTFSRKEWAVTLLLILAVSTLKLNSLTILPLVLLIPLQRLGPPKWLAAFILTAVITVLVVGLGWNYLTSSFLLNSETTETFSALDQLRGIFSNPAHFLTALTQSILFQAPRYLRDWIGVSGYEYWALPEPVYWLTPVLILAAILCDSTGEIFSRGKRIFSLGIALFAFFATWVLFYLLYTAPGTLRIPGIQGRYFIFLSPLLMVALMPAKPLITLKKTWLQAGSILVAALSMIGLFLAYHVPCGSAYYTPGLCLLPNYKNWAPENSQSLKITPSTGNIQTFSPACDNISQVQLWVNKKGSSNEPLSLKIFRDGAAEPVMSALVSQADIPPSGWLTVNFPDVTNTFNQKLLLEVSSSRAGANPEIEVGYTLRNEYLNGLMLINHQPQEGDFLFKYGCREGLEKLFSK